MVLVFQEPVVVQVEVVALELQEEVEGVGLEPWKATVSQGVELVVQEVVAPCQVELLEDIPLVELVHWELHLGKLVGLQTLQGEGVVVVGCSAEVHLNWVAFRELEGVGVEEGQMMGVARPAGCLELALDQLDASHWPLKVKLVVYDGQWAGLNTVESSPAVPGTLFHVSHTVYVVLSVSASLA